MIPDVSFITLVTDSELFRISSTSFRDALDSVNIQVIPVAANQNGWSAAEGLNHGLASAKHRWVVISHQDVLFPDAWWTRAYAQIVRWPRAVGVAGTFGVTTRGYFRGHILDPHGHRKSGPLPCSIGALDEHLLILDRNSGLRFDQAIPHFHCYGSDIVLQCKKMGLDAIALNAPVAHLSGGRLDDKFKESSAILAEKWKDYGMIATCATTIRSRTLRGLAMWPIYRVHRKLSLRQKTDMRLRDCMDDFRSLSSG